MAIDEAAVNAVYNAALSHVHAAGYFDSIAGHEPKTVPGRGLTAAMWAEYLGPAIGSGLAETSALLVINCRITTPMVTQTREQADAMDPLLLAACAAVISRWTGDLDLGGTCRCVDIRGMSGRRLEARGGYMNQDGRLCRVLSITLPIIINDAWTEAP